MALFAELADGRKLEFPDGTDPSVVQATVKKILGYTQDSPEVVKQKLAKAKQELADVDNMKIEPPNTFARRVVQGASSGPIMGGVQMIADATGNKELSDKIAKNAREGNFLGSMMQPEA